MNTGITKRVGWGLVLATAMAVIAAMALLAPAQAGLLTTSPETIKVSDSKIAATCTWTAKSANYTTGTVTGVLSGSARPRTLTIPPAVVHVSVSCLLVAPSPVGNLALHAKEADGSFVRFSEPKTVAFAPRYYVCASASYTLRNGETRSVDQKCS